MLNQLNDINTQNRHLKSDHITDDFPQFLWILRDFHEDLGLNTSADYMEKCLRDFWDANVDVDSSLGEEEHVSLKERVKRDKDKHLIKELFEHRGCFTLPIPMDDKSKLSCIFKLDESELSGKFIQNMKNFLQYMSLNINAKQLNSNSMTGNVFQNFLFDLIGSFNDQEIPMVNEISSRLFDYEARALLDDMVLNTEQHTESFKKELPMKELELHKKYDKYINETIHKFTEKTEKLSSVHTFATNQEFLLKQLTDNFDSLEELNIKKSKSEAETSLNEFIADYKIPSIVNKDSFSKEVVSGMKKQFMAFISSFLKTNDGPGASDKCLEVLPGFICETFGSVFSRVIDVFGSELGEVGNNLEVSKENLVQMKEYLKTQEESVIDLTREKNKLSDELEQCQHEIERLSRAKETEGLSLSGRITKLEEQVEKKKL
jgi:hypothetical protein